MGPRPVSLIEQAPTTADNKIKPRYALPMTLKIFIGPTVADSPSKDSP
jgi:hypothetical protein